MATSWRAGKEKTAARGYGGAWQRARLAFLQANPLCVMCEPRRVVLATVVDHRIPHRGDQALFWDMSNWQPLCGNCHSSVKASMERSGRVKPEIGPDGWPV